MAPGSDPGSLCVSNHGCCERIAYSTASRRRSGSSEGSERVADRQLRFLLVAHMCYRSPEKEH
jgi:hypothetical protein